MRHDPAGAAIVVMLCSLTMRRAGGTPSALVKTELEIPDEPGCLPLGAWGGANDGVVLNERLPNSMDRA